MNKIIYIILAIVYVAICFLSVFVFPPVGEQSFSILPVSLRIACWLIGIIVIVIKIIEENKK